MPERSFFFRGYQFPLCARCTGILIGNLAACCTFLIDIPLWIALMMIPMALDGLIQRYTSYESNNRRRLVTGLMWGFSSVTVLFGLIRLAVQLMLR